VTSRWFSAGTPVSSTNKTDRHDITEILLKVELNTIIKILINLELNLTIIKYTNILSVGQNLKKKTTTSKLQDYANTIYANTFPQWKGKDTKLCLALPNICNELLVSNVTLYTICTGQWPTKREQVRKTHIF